MGNQFGEWIADVEAPKGNAGGDFTKDSFVFTGTSETATGGDASGNWDWHIEAESSRTRYDDPDTLTDGCDHAVQTSDTYAGSHALYQDVTIPH